MKKTLFSVFIVIICSTFVEAVANPTNKNGIDRLVKKEMKLSQESITRAMSKLPINGNKAKQRANTTKNATDVIVDLWNTATSISLSEEGTYDEITNVLTFSGSEEQTNPILTGINENREYAWYAMKGTTYTFCGKLASDGYAEISPCFVYMEDEGDLYIIDGTTITLAENNNYNSEFNLTVTNELVNNKPLFVAFLIENSSVETTITCSENQFSSSYKTVIAQKWSEEIDIPGLVLNNIDSSNSYIVLCEDGITTLGLYYEGSDLYVTGINTTATEVWLPENITIDNVVEDIDYFGLYNNTDWSGAENLTQLHIESAKYVYADFSNSNITDVYIGNNCKYIETVGHHRFYK